MRNIIGLLKKIIINFANTYKLYINYYFIFIGVFVFFTFIIIRITGDNVLKHEAYVLKKEFIKRNEVYTLKTANRISQLFEDLDTISIVDLIEKIGKEEGIVYAYVLNGEGEVIAHTVKSEMFKNYNDKFINKKYLKYFLDHAGKIWFKEREFKGKKIIKFSKPIILQFARKDIMKELSMSAGAVTNQEVSLKSTNTNISGENNRLQGKFYIAGVLHIACSMEKLQMISNFSKKKVRIYYWIAYLLAIVAGYFAGNHFELSIKKINSYIESLLKGREVNPFKTEERIDSFKKIHENLNQVIARLKVQAENREPLLNQQEQKDRENLADKDKKDNKQVEERRSRLNRI